MSAALIEVHESQETYLASFASLERDARPWLRRLREDALQRFTELGFPTTRNEDWKYTNLAPWTRIPFERAGKSIQSRDRQGAVAVKGVTVTTLAEADPQLLEEHLGRYAGYDNNALVALNAAFLSDGVFIHIPDGVVLDEPIHLVFAGQAHGLPSVSYVRNLIVLGRNSQATIVEEYLGQERGVHFTNAVTEMVVGEGSILEHCKLQKESDGTFHFGALAVQQARSSNFTSHSIALGSALARNELRVTLNGEGAECALNGLYLVAGEQHVDNYTTIDHATPRSASRELYKGILDGSAQGVFHGRIIVRKDAQKTDAIQRNKNLLLSEKAVINTKPQLEIYADDVRCTHGATVGQVDPEAVFYLRSRGIALQDARRLLTYAFASDMIDRVKVAPVRSQLMEEVLARL